MSLFLGSLETYVTPPYVGTVTFRPYGIRKPGYPVDNERLYWVTA